MTSEKALSIYGQIEDIYLALKTERDVLKSKSLNAYLTRPERVRYEFIGRLMDKTQKVLEEFET